MTNKEMTNKEMTNKEMTNKEITSKEAFIKFTEYVVNIFNQRIDKNLRKDYFYNKYINFSINDFPLRKVLEDLEMLELLKEHLKNATFSDAFKVVEGERKFDFIKKEGYYTMNHISAVFNEEEKNKIERWLGND